MSTLEAPQLPTQPLSDEDLALLEYAFSEPDAPPAPAFRHRATLAPGELGEEVTTLGWDTNYVLQVNDVNTVLSKSPAMPKTFDKVVDPAENYTVDGTFAPWQIGLGGSGGIVFVSVPIPTGTMTYGDKSYDLSGATAYISLKLKYVPQLPLIFDAQSAPAGEVNDLLEVDDLKIDPQDRSDFDPAVVVQKLNLGTGTPPPSTLVRAMMIGALQEWFNDNIIQFSYIFATVSLNEIAAKDSEAFQWLKPTYTGYAYFDGPTHESSYFAVLTMTGNRSPSGLSFQIGPKSIPDGSTAGFNISMTRYIEEVIFPGLVKGFPHATATSFTLTANNTVIENTEDIRCDDVKVGAIWYTPYIKSFVLQVVGDEIQIYSRTVTNISPGIRSVVETTTFQTIEVVTKSDGSQTLGFKETQPPRKTSYIDKDIGITITEIVVSIAGAIAGGVASAIIKGVAKIIIACIIIAIVFGLAAATPELIAKVAGGGAAEALPPISLMVLNATNPVDWPGSAGFTLNSAAINGAFQLGGDPHITA